MKFLSLFFFWIAYTPFALSQDNKALKKVKTLPVPAIGYSPETRTYLGVVCLFTLNLHQDSFTRSSNTKVEFNYTWNKQIIVEGAWNFFSKQEKWFSKGLVRYAQYPDFYFGIGSNSPDLNKIVFESNRTLIDVQILKNVGSNFFSGPGIKYTNYARVRTEDKYKQYPELTPNQTLGISYTLVNDSRNNILSPTKGYYLQAHTTYNFAHNNYLEINLDVRWYKTNRNKIVFATRLVNDLNFGTVPFYDLALLGGDQFVRGYFLGRYRDQHMGTLQQEMRVPLLGRLGLAAFGGLSNTYSARYPFRIKEVKYNYGLGLRYIVDKKEKTNLRIDYAQGILRNNGFYISFGESF